MRVNPWFRMPHKRPVPVKASRFANPLTCEQVMVRKDACTCTDALAVVPDFTYESGELKKTEEAACFATD